MFNGCEILDGFHPIERDDLGCFAWTQASFRIRLHRDARFARFELCYYGDLGTLSVHLSDGARNEVPMHRGWQSCVLAIENRKAGENLNLLVAPIIAVVGDSRTLGVMLREIELFDEPGRYERLVRTGRNLRLNQHEFETGQMELASSPPQLRVNLAVRCNIPEEGQACVYCAWDWAKTSERGSPAFTLAAMDDLGEIYQSAIEVVDCSYGEPTMNKEFGAIIERFDDDGKQVSLTTNGQLLTARRRRELVGKNVMLYTSIDSATAAGYTRYRNDRFDDLIANLTALCREKKQFDDLPRVHVAFIAMHSNVDELPQFFDLMRDVGVDEVKLRTLYLDDNLAPVATNNGYRFDYAQELLSMSELEALAPVARQLARERGVSLYVEWEQFPVNVHSSGGPLCSEPWKTLYMLRRGIMPCCYATRPIATWDQQQGRPLGQFLQDVFNGDAFQEIRSELAAGRLAEYCRNTPSCPILKDMQQQGLVETSSGNLYQLHAISGLKVVSPLVPLESLRSTIKKSA